MTLLELDNVKFSYINSNSGTPFTLNAASIEVAKGEFITILGPNGSGKSTLLKIISGVLYPQIGDVLLQGKPH